MHILSDVGASKFAGKCFVIIYIRAISVIARSLVHVVCSDRSVDVDVVSDAGQRYPLYPEACELVRPSTHYCP